MLSPAYLRLSYKLVNGELIEEDRDGLSRQRKDLTALAARYDAALAEDTIFLEDDTSGEKVRGAKTRWAACLAYIREHRPPFLFGTAADRLGRRLSDIESLNDLCKATGTRVITLREGELFASVAWPFIAAQAKVEAMNTRIRVMASQRHRRTTGKDGNGGNRPYGYAADRLTVIPHEAEVIETMARRAIKGESLNAIAGWLNETETPRPYGTGRWSVGVVRTILQNRRYIGRLVHEGQDVGKAAWPIILDTGTFDAVQLSLAKRLQPRIGPPQASLLGGLLRCAACQTSMHATHSGTIKTPIYRCASNANSGGCGKTWRGREALETYVVTHALAALDATVLNDERETLYRQYEDAEGRVMDATLNIMVLKAARDEGKISAADYFEDLDRMRTAERRLQRQAAELKNRVSEAEHSSRAADRWESWSVAEQRAFLHSRIVAVMVQRNERPGLALNRPIAPGEVEIVERHSQ